MESRYIPKEAFRYIPNGNSVSINSDSNIVRFIFYKTPFTLFEQEHLASFLAYLSSLNIDTSSLVHEELLRILIGCRFNYKKSHKALMSGLEWRQNTFPYGLDSLFLRVSNLLNSGMIYIHGRDHKYRPLVILNAGRMDLVNNTVEDYTFLLCYILEFAITKLMIPGVIENWVILTDLNGQSLRNLPVSQLKQIIKVLQDNYRCRMIVNYVVNAPKSLSFFWNIVKRFLEPHTINKIRIFHEAKPEDIINHFALSQFEEKYGGTSPNLTEGFWPPVLPKGPFTAIGDEVQNGTFLSNSETNSLKSSETFYSLPYSSDFRTCVSKEESYKNSSIFLDTLSENNKTKSKLKLDDDEKACCSARCLIF